jgi:hypothetical protein
MKKKISRGDAETQREEKKSMGGAGSDPFNFV